MISSETMQQARELASGAVSNIFRQIGKKVNLAPIEDNELTIHCFDDANKPAFSATVNAKSDLDVLYFSGDDRGWRFVAVIRTDQGELAIADSGKLIYETISEKRDIDKVIVSTFPSRSSHIEAKPPLLTDNVSSLLGASGVKDGGVSTGFFATDSADNRQFVVEAVRLLREQEEYIVFDEGRTLSHMFSDSTWHPSSMLDGEPFIENGIIYVNIPDATHSLSANNYDEYGDLASLLPFIEEARIMERQYTTVLTAKNQAESKGKSVNSTNLSKLTSLLQKSAEKVRGAHEDFNDKNADIADDRSDKSTASPTIDSDGDIEEKARQSSQDLTRTKSRKR